MSSPVWPGRDITVRLPHIDARWWPGIITSIVGGDAVTTYRIRGVAFIDQGATNYNGPVVNFECEFGEADDVANIPNSEPSARPRDGVPR